MSTNTIPVAPAMSAAFTAPAQTPATNPQESRTARLWSGIKNTTYTVALDNRATRSFTLETKTSKLGALVASTVVYSVAFALVSVALIYAGVPITLSLVSGGIASAATMYLIASNREIPQEFTGELVQRFNTIKANLKDVSKEKAELDAAKAVTTQVDADFAEIRESLLFATEEVERIGEKLTALQEEVNALQEAENAAQEVENALQEAENAAQEVENAAPSLMRRFLGVIGY